MQIEQKCQCLHSYSGSQKNVPVKPVLTTFSWATNQLIPILLITTDAYTSALSFKTAEQ